MTAVDATSAPAARPIPFELRVRIDPADFDELGHVNNTVYLRWVQEVAAAHWREIAPADAQHALAWVVRRHEIDYFRSIVPGDSITAVTWVGAVAGMLFERHTEIVSLPDSFTLARARTLWCPVDAATGKPRRASPLLRSLFSTTRPELPGGGQSRRSAPK
jgi:acyl-CoA thioester hydrolase